MRYTSTDTFHRGAANKKRFFSFQIGRRRASKTTQQVQSLWSIVIDLSHWWVTFPWFFLIDHHHQINTAFQCMYCYSPRPQAQPQSTIWETIFHFPTSLPSHPSISRLTTRPPRQEEVLGFTLGKLFRITLLSCRNSSLSDDCNLSTVSFFHRVSQFQPEKGQPVLKVAGPKCPCPHIV